jgi:NAD(P)-dependent dehydrogenase (short-subunit alcohol dehydrogenase family)
VTARLEGRVALVTGAGQGIGLAIVRRFVDEGAKVVMFGRTVTTLRAAAQGFSSDDVAVVVGDIAIRAQVLDGVTTALTRFGRLDIAVAHAGIASVTDFLDITDQEWARTIDVNVTGSFYTMQESARAMTRGGSIIVTSSQNGFFPQYRTAHYSASKAALITLAKSASLDLASRGIRVNALSPGFIDTPLAAPLVNSIETSKTILSTVPLERFGRDDEVAACALFLASDESSYVTGSNLVVDGGATVGMSMGDGATAVGDAHTMAPGPRDAG